MWRTTFVQLLGVFLGALIMSISGQGVSDIACTAGTRPAVLTDYTGTFTTQNNPQNYPDNAVCQWLIVSQEPGGWVKLDFDSFFTQATVDIVIVYDGDNENAPILAGFEGVYDALGVTPPYGIISSQQYMLVTFTSDASGNRPGFSATYTSIAPFEVKDACVASSRPLNLNDYSGTITSTNYPGGNYWNYQTCEWVIGSQEPGGTVSLTFTAFFTESNGDYVDIYDGPTTESPIMAHISGQQATLTYQSSQTYLTVVFTSNSLLSRSGFTADYTSVAARGH